MIPGWVRMALATGVILFVAACRDAKEHAPSQPVAPPVCASPMAGYFRDLASRRDAEHPCFTRMHLDKLEKSLVSARADGSAPEVVWNLLVAIGLEESRLGDLEASLVHLDEALEVGRSVEATKPHPLMLGTLWAAAIANFRYGETQNCVARHTAQSCIFPIREAGVHVDQRGSRRGIELLSELLRRKPEADAARWLLNIAYMTIGGYPGDVPTEWLIAEAAYASKEPFARFVDAATRLRVDNRGLSGGVTAADFDDDGDDDLVVTNSDPAARLIYFENDSRGGFAERGSEVGFGDILGGANVIQGDYDDDGRIDVLVLRGAWLGAYGKMPLSLLRNVDGRRFVDMTVEAGLGDERWPTQSAAFFDYDNDGDLDLYVAHESGTEGAEVIHYASHLFRNEGDGCFVDVTKSAGVENGRSARGVTVGDFDEDGFDDLYVSNAMAPNRLYRNLGDGRFVDVAPALGLVAPRNGSASTWFFDYDGDGHLDLFAAEHDIDTDMVAAAYLGKKTRAERARLWRGNGKTFEDVTDAAGLSRVALVLGGNFGDLDGDGSLDMYWGTGHSEHHGLMPNLAWRNRGDGTFAEITTNAGFGHLQKGNGTALVDFDNDGDLDVYQVIGGLYPSDAFGDVLFENPGTGRSFVRLRLEGDRTNRFGVGARIDIEFTSEGRRRRTHLAIGQGPSFGSTTMEPMIGLDRATKIDRLSVRWPVTGERQVFEDLPADRHLRIREGSMKVAVESWRKRTDGK